MKISQDRAENVLARLAAYEKIDTHGRPRDEVGWIALAFSIERPEAARLIKAARAAKRHAEICGCGEGPR
jgi:hypothetical protein